MLTAQRGATHISSRRLGDHRALDWNAGPEYRAPTEVTVPSGTERTAPLPAALWQNPVVSRPQSGSTPSAAARSAYPSPAAQPTQAGAHGILFDFNAGARVLTPAKAKGAWRVRLLDLDTGNLLFESTSNGALVCSRKRYYVRFGIEVWDETQPGAPPVLQHDHNLAGREVLIQFPVGTLGDTLAWFPYAARFAEAHPGARLTCALSALIIPLLQDAYPHVRLVTHEALAEAGAVERFYATYNLGLFFDDDANAWQPTDFRLAGLHRTAGYILGVDAAEAPPRLALPDDSRPLAEPYACIAVQSSSGCKYWNNPEGWRAVVLHLQAQGLRVVCIDQKPVHGAGLMWTHIPHGAEDETGDRPLVERARWLRHAALFVGLSSGLSWLAWAAGCPVVLISGFTHPTNEFATPYRVINWHACNSCWNDPRARFDHHDFMWCPRHAGTPRQFECTRLITAQQVITALGRIPGLPDRQPPR